ncbi:uncharacterized protein LOC141658779 [Silene latifolia]|uniref:uncharacterized protein LOC141658779 n=1 Tax=Silene latifolia TaxID=37657 RepID=UPI003D7828F6
MPINIKAALRTLKFTWFLWKTWTFSLPTLDSIQNKMRSYTEYLRTFFEKTFLCSQKLLSSEQSYEKVLDLMSVYDSNSNWLVSNNIPIFTNIGLLHFSIIVFHLYCVWCTAAITADL